MGHQFRQVNVFAHDPIRGNPVAVVHAADDLSEHQMSTFARWTNLSETTFLLRPVDESADYRVRIFTTDGELPFAGHPTLGTAHAWLEAGGVPRRSGTVVQECAAGLVEVRTAGTLAFAAPPMRRSGPVEPADRARIAESLCIRLDDIVAAQWVDNGPGWVAALLPDARAVLDLEPDFPAMGDLAIGVVGQYPAGMDTGVDVEVRAFCPGHGVNEDPVTGSLNAGIAQWLIGSGVLPPHYRAAQGTCIGRLGRIQIDQEGATTWVGGATNTTIVGTAELGAAPV